MKSLPITHATLITALGAGLAAHAAALQAGACGLRPCDFEDVVLPGWIGPVAGLEQVALPAALAGHACRNHQLAWLGLQQDGFAQAVHAARERWGAHRVAVLLGTSTSGILETEHAYRRRGPDGALPGDFHYASTHSTAAVAHFVRLALGLEGPAWVVSTACSSSAKVFGDAARLIEAGLVDAAVVGGVDSLCLTTLYGFHSLELFSPEICRPWDAGRCGISIGEAAAFALLQREDGADAPVGRLLGVGESSDGHHMSSPHPEGAGAALAMQRALADAGLQPPQIDYVNLHGTATPNNDAAEDRAVEQVLGRDVPCSSTKGATGHTLGAAGGVEAVLGLIAIREGLMPGGLNLRERDPGLRIHYLGANRRGTVRHVLSNSFGFGGSNASLVLGAA
ncbi:MAG TPA: beta-ketoacyl-[acyl-carrier-protein] synthase family protein [Ramlibacter sp.]|jgi:3-oxoacyl-[acyl-carrier-protein] synthase-1|uniref:beta-ketoacyl-[acyl-carrier-protein] synthase family protein n=1 Tax=Ramlibacter sp. TaxID=1917967 RepID=UPI002D3CC668|nr:beta-ketoacyl-[acyl-carrier-protein] synthase family protein [Ramlibacter sp.]HZY19968.1 beta-ketoacyl-[acyl-carrier-protein] synthase family protein [Ramlibacter sp.]